MGTLEGMFVSTSSFFLIRQMLTVHEKKYSEIFELDKLVYLTADSPNVIETIDPKKIYIVGGIVDHNRLKVCFFFLHSCNYFFHCLAHYTQQSKATKH
jgi:hypothetical protein